MLDTPRITVKFIRVISLALLAVCLSNCSPKLRGGSGGRFSEGWAVADTANSRVVLYNAPISTNQAAAVFLGQPDSTSNTANNGGVSAATMNHPFAVAESTNQDLIATDAYNCRILLFATPFSTGMAATTILGQPNGTTASCASADALTASSLNTPAGAAVDTLGNLWVADVLGHRVLKFVPPFTNGMAASVALGQTTTSSTSGTYGCNQVSGGAALAPTAGTLCEPLWVAFDASGNLWVTDLGNNRVLMYPPAQQIQGGVATLVLGQADFVSNSSGLSATNFDAPADLAFDSNGNLWVTDIRNNRALKFAPPFSDGMAASAVLGQTDFVSGASGTSASNLSGPVGLAFDSSGNLAVVDSVNNRTLIFPPAQQVTGGSAGTVLGQPDLASGNPNQGGSPSAKTESLPLGVLGYN
jgi:sugar lactone lactonase YvrE